MVPIKTRTDVGGFSVLMVDDLVEFVHPNVDASRSRGSRQGVVTSTLDTEWGRSRVDETKLRVCG